VDFIRLGVASACRLILLLQGLDFTGVFCPETKSLVSKDLRYGLCMTSLSSTRLAWTKDGVPVLSGASNERDFHFAFDDRVIEKGA
jgi:hypothetical protein